MLRLIEMMRSLSNLAKGNSIGLEPVAMMMFLPSRVSSPPSFFGNFYMGSIYKTSHAVKNINLVFVHQKLYAIAGLVNHALLAGNHFFEINHRFFYHDSVLGKLMNRFAVVLTAI